MTDLNAEAKRRVLACLDALDGISTEHIEQFKNTAPAIELERVREQRQELLAALNEAIRLIEFYHGPTAWDIYYEHSPEMKRLRAAIAKCAP